jgi:membrane dipeptidase
LPIFDGHNDTLLRLWRKGLPVSAFLERGEAGHLDLPRARDGGFAGGLFACFVPSDSPEDELPTPERGGNAVAFPGTPSRDRALAVTVALAARLERIAREPGSTVAVCRTAADIRHCLETGAVAAVLHIEGAEAIDPELEALDVLYAAGLRSLGPVWSRPNAFGHGVPFRFPSTPDTGRGLTDAGKALVKACNERRIMVDLSHLNEAGFWDVAALSDAPLVATHSNAHALCACSRNLTDRQLDAIRATGGVVGLNLAVSFLRPDGRNDADTPVETLVDHVDHLVSRLGIDGVALGTDFDGCTVPACIKDAAGLPVLIEALRARGYGEAELRKFGHENWLAVLERTWGA